MYKKLARKITNHCIDNPIITICFALFITALAFSGIRHVKQDDNMVNLLPEDIGSRVIFEEIQDDYTDTPFLKEAEGNIDIINKVQTLKQLIDEFMTKRAELEEFEKELKKYKKEITPGQIGES